MHVLRGICNNLAYRMNLETNFRVTKDRSIHTYRFLIINIGLVCKVYVTVNDSPVKFIATVYVISSFIHNTMMVLKGLLRV